MRDSSSDINHCPLMLHFVVFVSQAQLKYRSSLMLQFQMGRVSRPRKWWSRMGGGRLLPLCLNMVLRHPQNHIEGYIAIAGTHLVGIPSLDSYDMLMSFREWWVS